MLRPGPGVERALRRVSRAREVAGRRGTGRRQVRLRKVAQAAAKGRAEYLRGYLAEWLDGFEGERLAMPERRFYERVAATAGRPDEPRVCRCGRVFRGGRRGRLCSDACRKVRPVAVDAPTFVRRDPDSGHVEQLAECECGATVWARPGQRWLCGSCGSGAGRQRRAREP